MRSSAQNLAPKSSAPKNPAHARICQKCAPKHAKYDTMRAFTRKKQQ
ncbi:MULTISPECIES: hypothetical protein [unclassified Helicobacter]|nr:MULTISPECIES: hypothetical protein [unclassified Helicobacter]